MSRGKTLLGLTLSHEQRVALAVAVNELDEAAYNRGSVAISSSHDSEKYKAAVARHEAANKVITRHLYPEISETGAVVRSPEDDGEQARRFA